MFRWWSSASAVPASSRLARPFRRARGARRSLGFRLRCGFVRRRRGAPVRTGPSSGPAEWPFSAFPGCQHRRPLQRRHVGRAPAPSLGECLPPERRGRGRAWGPRENVRPTRTPPSKGCWGRELAVGQLLCFEASLAAVSPQRASLVLRRASDPGRRRGVVVAVPTSCFFRKIWRGGRN